MHRMVGSMFLSMLGSIALAQQAPVPVEQEPHHRVILKNDSVLAMRVTLAPGESTLYHTHSHDRVAVELGDTTITQQEPGKPEGQTETVKPGDVRASTRGEAPYSHRVKNVGAKLFDVIDVELLERPEQPSAPVAGVHLFVENPSARVYKFTLAPGAVSIMHTHERPYLIVAASTMMLKMTAPDGKSATHEIKAGDFHWVDSKVTHALANEGTTEGQIVEIELK